VLGGRETGFGSAEGAVATALAFGRALGCAGFTARGVGATGGAIAEAAAEEDGAASATLTMGSAFVFRSAVPADPTTTLVSEAADDRGDACAEPAGACAEPAGAGAEPAGAGAPATSLRSGDCTTE
jgi:hypothetical protein